MEKSDLVTDTIRFFFCLPRRICFCLADSGENACEFLLFCNFFITFYLWRMMYMYQCSESGSRPVGSVCFWASRIRKKNPDLLVRDRDQRIRIRIRIRTKNVLDCQHCLRRYKVFLKGRKLGLFVIFDQFLCSWIRICIPSSDLDPDPGQSNECESIQTQIHKTGLN